MTESATSITAANVFLLTIGVLFTSLVIPNATNSHIYRRTAQLFTWNKQSGALRSCSLNNNNNSQWNTVKFGSQFLELKIISNFYFSRLFFRWDLHFCIECRTHIRNKPHPPDILHLFYISHQSENMPFVYSVSNSVFESLIRK